MTILLSHDLTAAQLDALVDKAGGRDRVLELLAGRLDLRLSPAGGDFEGAGPIAVTVPDAPGFEARVARGGYGWRHEDLTETAFPLTPDGFGAFEQKLYHFNRNIASEDAARLIVEDGYEPARIADMLVFGELFPQTQVRHPVVGLGSVAEVEGKRSAPTLWFDGARRTLDLLWLDGDWHRNYRFLGVRRR